LNDVVAVECIFVWSPGAAKERLMETYEFTVIASGLDHNADDFEDRFYEAGCDDALVAFQSGHIIVDFTREANSIEEAIASAIENIRSIGTSVDRVVSAEQHSCGSQ
jgi:TATA-box binding protein (TBP) (component of TFIID and TFIIIB)